MTALERAEKIIKTVWEKVPKGTPLAVGWGTFESLLAEEIAAELEAYAGEAVQKAIRGG